MRQSPQPSPRPGGRRPGHRHRPRRRRNPIAGSYIVVLKDAKATPGAVGRAARDLAARHAGAVTYTYTARLRGFAAKMTEAQAKRLAADPRVASVEQDGVVSLAATQSPVDLGPGPHRPARPAAEQLVHLRDDRANVHAYIIDTGIRTTHSDFGGRASAGFDAIGDGSNGQDCNGHGTHVAGTVGGATYGVAKGVSARRRPGAQLRRQRHQRRRHRRRRLGDRATRSSRRSRT